MSDQEGRILTAERLAEIRGLTPFAIPPQYSLALADLLGHIEALRAENDRLTSQVAAYREAVEGALEFGDRYLTEHERELCRLGDDTEAAALEGA